MPDYYILGDETFNVKPPPPKDFALEEIMSQQTLE